MLADNLKTPFLEHIATNKNRKIAIYSGIATALYLTISSCFLA